ncbi:substrate-binding domain-containing protein [Verminephrobacter eiseniae]|uniref:Extracellular ligand-binding receptor n=1 Tax=Verminephrobacter eiseniae (strain EF01-2) TaxID=391735 RepID=A1WER5_VEREI|nr:substrate-binding domain-containing protein [Verminephrobacter eiseniae]ABM56122.1 Extracellular ligand-binding receptor [Verminephrobacter eiseniae EF01-2]MCW5286494.1 ABC transporter permease [Verminephrobacter eiseniae]MCW5304793.1 ABC transporter permease [Verminephrobacter eiseniae]MCW8178834.1 ABC transporter permease [Verminephrobacter eiseniae]MCW8190752.1 ABC transporter permease [Verminephrobacter eiseniae]
MHRRHLPARAALAVLALAISAAAVFAQTGEIRIAHVYSKTGPLQAYGMQTQTGLSMGLNYATGGSMMVDGKKLVLIEKDDQGKPDLGRSLLAAAYADDKADIAVGPSSSGVALAMLPVAQEYKKILLVEPAVADSITGDKWSPYIFRTGRNSSQDAIANAAAIDKPGVSVATLAQDYAFGRDGVKAFKDALQHARLVHEEYLPTNTTDFTAGAQRLIDKLKGLPGRKLIFILWAGAGNPFKIADMDLKRYGIEITTGGNTLSGMAAYKNFPGMEGATYYYFGIPKNPVNQALVAAHYKAYKTPPDFFTAGGFSAAMALVTALEATKGDTDSRLLIKTMEGMEFDTPKGRMHFRKEDHQAMQSMYHFRIEVDPALPWGVPALVREIGAQEMNVPIRNRRQ